MSESEHPAGTTERGGAVGYVEARLEGVVQDFYDPRFEGRRLFSEFLGTFFLVLVARVAPSSTHRAAGAARVRSRYPRRGPR